MRPKIGDYIRILDPYGAMWLRKGEIYMVEETNGVDGLKVNGQWWGHDREDYEIVSSQAGEPTRKFKIGDEVELLPGCYNEGEFNPIKTKGVVSRFREDSDYYYHVVWSNGCDNHYREKELKLYVAQPEESKFDQEAAQAHQRRLARENALQRAAIEYCAGTDFISFGGEAYTIADKPGFNWSENTEGIYANTTSGMRTYICKRGEWVKKVNVNLLAEAKEMFPPGTRFVNSYGTTSTVSDDPEYSLANGFVFAKCKTGSLVRIHTGVKWADIVTRPSSSDTTRRKPQNGDQVYITQYATGCIAKYKNQWVEVKEISYEENDALYMRFPDDSKYLVLKSEWSWTEPEQETPATSEFNVGDVVQVTKSCAYFNIGYVSTIIKVDSGSVLMRNHKDGDWWISKDHIRHHFHSLFDKVEIPEYVKDTDKYKDLFFNLKTKQHGTESNKSVKLQGINLQIREGNLSRGVGLKSSRSKIKLGSNYSYN